MMMTEKRHWKASGPENRQPLTFVYIATGGTVEGTNLKATKLACFEQHLT